MHFSVVDEHHSLRQLPRGLRRVNTGSCQVSILPSCTTQGHAGPCQELASDRQYEFFFRRHYRRPRIIESATKKTWRKEQIY